MSKDRKNWGEAFALGLLIGLVAAASYISGRPQRQQQPSTGVPTIELPRKALRQGKTASRLADLPSPSAAIH